jgi:uncharacterized protein (DUF433 family)
MVHRNGGDFDDFLSDYPTLTAEQARAVLLLADDELQRGPDGRGPARPRSRVEVR